MELGQAFTKGPEIVEVEVTGITFPSDPKQKDGYQLRFLLRHSELIEQWTPWMYLTNSAMEDLQRVLLQQMTQEGHLATGHGRQVQ